MAVPLRHGAIYRTQFSFENHIIVPRALRLLGVVGTVALILAIVGGTSMSDAKSQSDLNSATTERHVSAIMFAGLYAGVVFMVGYCWMNQHLIPKYRRQVSPFPSMSYR